MVSKLVVNRNWFRFGFGFRCFGFSALSTISALSAEIHQLWPKIALDTFIITLLANLAETISFCPKHHILAEMKSFGRNDHFGFWDQAVSAFGVSGKNLFRLTSSQNVSDITVLSQFIVDISTWRRRFLRRRLGRWATSSAPWTPSWSGRGGAGGRWPTSTQRYKKDCPRLRDKPVSFLWPLSRLKKS